MKKLISISAISIVIDFIIKLIIKSNMTLNSSITIINNFFNLTYVNNYGAAWSILIGSRVLLIIIALFALLFIYHYLKNKKLSKLEYISYGLLMGGIIGNLIDRIVYGYVIDYLDFCIFGYDFPIFNLADSCIVIAVIVLMYITFKGEKYDNSRK